ncbi:TetR/AcrR family transcriptional regulator [Aestuariibius insulae]|uniref:TetR/AcrR family transcriptional regulator n=1 Tax=Aestuariibius insulae TaxID=2058287 RepID=UPI00345E6495
MARQIEYDPLALQETMMKVFWAQGYAETSLSDIESATGLNRRQLYNGVGDKRQMFLGALDDFSALAGRRFLAQLESDEAGVADIETLLRTFLELALTPDGPTGCLVCSSSQEEIASDADVASRIDTYFDRIRDAYFNALRRAVNRGDLALTDAQVASRAEALFGTHVALCILGRAGRPVEQLKRMVDQALEDIA